MAVRRWRTYQGRAVSERRRPSSFRIRRRDGGSTWQAGTVPVVAARVRKGPGYEDQDRFRHGTLAGICFTVQSLQRFPRRIEDPGHTAIVVLGPHIFPLDVSIVPANAPAPPHAGLNTKRGKHHDERHCRLPRDYAQPCNFGNCVDDLLCHALTRESIRGRSWCSSAAQRRLRGSTRGSWSGLQSLYSNQILF